jgi:hypothetical protein
VKISDDVPLVEFHRQPCLVHLKLEENKMFHSSFQALQMTGAKYVLQSMELHDVKLQLLRLGDHQRQNAVTASCTALCLRQPGNELNQFGLLFKSSLYCC